MKNLGEQLAASWLNKSFFNLSTLAAKDIPLSRKDAFEAQNFFYKSVNKKTAGWKIGAVSKEIQEEEGYDGPVPGKIFLETILPFSFTSLSNLVPRVLEARGLDVTPRIRKKFKPS